MALNIPVIIIKRRNIKKTAQSRDLSTNFMGGTQDRGGSQSTYKMASVDGKYDSAFLGILQNEGKIADFLDQIFSFMYRRFVSRRSDALVE